MSAPEIIPVKYSEYLAQYADIRPVRLQPMHFEELVGLVLTHTGKDRERLREILRQGTCTYNIYKYWWEAIDPDYTQLELALDTFPDPEPGRCFDPACCLWVRFSDNAEPKPRQVTVEKEEAGQRRFWVRQSFWVFLMQFAAARPPAYADYSYYDKADLFSLELDATKQMIFLEGVSRLAAGAVRRRLARAPEFQRVELACTRQPGNLASAPAT